MSRSRAGLLALALTAGLVCAGTSVLPAPASAAQPADKADRAEKALRAHPEQVALDGDDALQTKDVITDPSGATHVRFTRTRGGLPVVGGDLVVHQAPDGTLTDVSATTRKQIAVGRSARVSRQQAEQAARDAATNGASSVDAGVLEIDSRDASAPALVWSVVVHGTQTDQTPSELLTLVDARSGRVVEQHEQVETAADDRGFFVGAVDLTTTAVSGGYSLKDPSRGGQYTVDMGNKQGGSGTLFTDADNLWGDGTLANRQTVAVDAQYGTGQTWDYYKAVHARTGIDDKGTGASNRVHYGRNYNNAYWSDSCYCMTYGDGDGTTYNPFDSLDVAGHEMSHGVTSRTANLTYSGESGGLNEANSDIFGTAVEFFANDLANPAHIAPGLDDPDYKIGEELYKNQSTGKALRYMYNPNLDGQSPNCYSSSIGSLDVHYSSGVANRFAFLLAEGSTTAVWGPQPALCAGNTGAVSGIGRDAAQKVWYRALTVYMTSSTNYSGARAATLKAAADLDGTGAYATAVTNAWNAVGVTK